MHRRTVTLGVALTLLLSPSASAQPLQSSPPPVQTGFGRMRARLGDFLYVNDPDRKVEISGRLASLSDRELSIDGYRFAPKPGLKIERRGDTIWDGALLGFVIGGLAGVTVGAEGCLRRPMIECFAGGGLVYGAIGAYWDSQHIGRTTVFLGGPAATETTAGTAGASEVVPASVTGTTAFDFSTLNLKLGDHVAVTASDGTQTTGVITAMNRDAFRVGAVDLSATSPTLVERIGDPIWDGAAWGVGVAAIQAVGQCTVRCGAKLAVIYGAIGAIIDASIKGRTRVYGSSDTIGRGTSLRVIPEIDAHRKAVAVAIGFK
jgi:hypothetical protein